MMTVDPALKKQFIEVFTMLPHSTVIDASGCLPRQVDYGVEGRQRLTS
jgi:hypothetical protein